MRTRPPREPGMERNGTEREKNGTVYPYNIRFLPVLLKTGTRATAVLRNRNGKFFVTPTVHVHVHVPYYTSCMTMAKLPTHQEERPSLLSLRPLSPPSACPSPPQQKSRLNWLFNMKI